MGEIEKKKGTVYPAIVNAQGELYKAVAVVQMTSAYAEHLGESELSELCEEKSEALSNIYFVVEDLIVRLQKTNEDLQGFEHGIFLHNSMQTVQRKSA